MVEEFHQGPQQHRQQELLEWRDVALSQFLLFYRGASNLWQ